MKKPGEGNHTETGEEQMSACAMGRTWREMPETSGKAAKSGNNNRRDAAKVKSDTSCRVEAEERRGTKKDGDRRSF